MHKLAAKELPVGRLMNSAVGGLMAATATFGMTAEMGAAQAMEQAPRAEAMAPELGGILEAAGVEAYALAGDGEWYEAFCTVNGWVWGASFTSDCDFNGKADYQEAVDLIADINAVSNNPYVVACNKKNIFPSKKSDCNNSGFADYSEIYLNHYNTDTLYIDRLANSVFYYSCLANGTSPYLLADCLGPRSAITDGRADVLQALDMLIEIESAIINLPSPSVKIPIPVVDIPAEAEPPTTSSPDDRVTPANQAPKTMTPAERAELGAYNQMVADHMVRGVKATKFFSSSSVPNFVGSSLRNSDGDKDPDISDPEKYNANVDRSNDRSYTLDNKKK